MELKKFIEKVKTIKTKNSLLDLAYDILLLEELIVESAVPTKEINQLGDVLKSSFVIVSENKIEINNKENPDLDLDNWKNSIGKYRLTNPVSKEVYLYTLRNSLKNLMKSIEDKDEVSIKVFIFELIIKTFLYIDYLDFSIDSILENKIKLFLPVKIVEKEIKEEVKDK
jgi:hypothetical protein